MPNIYLGVIRKARLLNIAIAIVRVSVFGKEYTQSKAQLLAKGAPEEMAHAAADTWVDVRARYWVLRRLGYKV